MHMRAQERRQRDGIRRKRREARAELARIGTADVVLHYGARAYHRLGCPVWLPGVLAKWKQRFGGRLMIIVHELPGEMPMTSRHFWLGQVDAWIVRRLSRIADVLVTNTQLHLDKLRSITGRADVHLLPVGSNIPVTAQPSDPPRSSTEFVIFGLPFGRLQTLRKFAADIMRWHGAGRMTKLHLIGPADYEWTPQAEALIANWPATLDVTAHGALPAEEVSAVLHQSRFALTNVSAETWSKSGAFMACAAHGCAVIVESSRSADAPFCYAIEREELAAISDEEINRRAAALAQWYHDNADWPVIANRMASFWQKGDLARVG